MLDNLKKYNIILASKSPRRKQLLEELGIQFEIQIKEVDEIFPETMPVSKIPEYLAQLKMQAFENKLGKNDLVITSDTIVCINNEVLGKPINYEHAYKMLTKLSGKAHKVISGVCVLSKNKKVSFTSTTKVYFKKLSETEIDYYISNYKPYDKAGAYGIQEWIGHVAIERIEGSYFNVMGLPVQRLYEELGKF